MDKNIKGNKKTLNMLCILQSPVVSIKSLLCKRKTFSSTEMRRWGCLLNSSLVTEKLNQENRFHSFMNPAAVIQTAASQRRVQQTAPFTKEPRLPREDRRTSTWTRRVPVTFRDLLSVSLTPAIRRRRRQKTDGFPPERKCNVCVCIYIILLFYICV